MRNPEARSRRSNAVLCAAAMTMFAFVAFVLARVGGSFFELETLNGGVVALF